MKVTALSKDMCSSIFTPKDIIPHKTPLPHTSFYIFKWSELLQDS